MIELIRSLDEVMALRAEWDRLYLESDESNPFLTHRWVTTLLRHITPAFAVAALRVAPGAPLDAVLPFEVHGDHWSTLNQHSARPGVLARADQRFALPTILLDLLLREPRAQDARRLLLRDVSALAGGVPALRRELGSLALVAVDQGVTPSHLISTREPYQSWLAGRAPKVRRELERKARRFAEELPEAELVELDTTIAAEADAAIEAVGRVEEDSWKQRERTAIISHPQEVAFYREVLGFAETRPRPMRGRFWLLGTRARPIAFVIGLEHDGVLYVLKNSYRDDCARLAPGLVLFCRLFERLAGERSEVQRVDLLGVDARWKRELATDTRIEARVELWRPAPAAVAYLVYARMRPLLVALAGRHQLAGRALADARAVGRMLVGR